MTTLPQPLPQTLLQSGTPPACPACGAPGPHEVHLRPAHGEGTWPVLLCRACTARFYNPLPQTEDMKTFVEIGVLRWYLEQNVNLWFYAAQLGPVLSARALAARPPGAMLDIGCGYGFALDLAKRGFGWRVQGVEPSDYGPLGAQALGVPILQGLLTEDDPFGGQKFDLICASQVIEHIPDPGAFIDMLRRYLAPGGVIALTTPSAEAIDNPALDPGMRDALLSVGSHTVLFSAESLRRLLAARGLPHVEVRIQLDQLIAYASAAPLDLAPIDPAALLVEYLRRAIAELPDGMIREAMRGRLYRMLVEQGDYPAAELAWPSLNFPPPGSLEGVADFPEFLVKYPSNAAAIAYLRGMQILNGGRRDTAQAGAEAAVMFGWSFEICRWRCAIAGADCSEEGGMLWSARFHQAFALWVAGQPAPAAAFAREVMTASGVDAALRARAAELYGEAHVPAIVRFSRRVQRGLARRLRRLV